MPEALARVQELIVSFIVSQPGFLVALVVFLIFYFAGAWSGGLWCLPSGAAAAG